MIMLIDLAQMLPSPSSALGWEIYKAIVARDVNQHGFRRLKRGLMY
jgi:hypothetical protein